VPVIPKTAKEDRLGSNFDIFSFDLSDDEMLQIDGLNENKHFCWDPNTIL
jgi:diketogulonate reductase-like aldo/keto reductase